MKIKILILCALGLSFFANAQRNDNFYLGLKAGALLNGRVQFYQGIFNPASTASTGIVIGKNINKFYAFELEYNWGIGANAFYTPYNPLNTGFQTKFNTHYFMLNGIHKIPTAGNISPFVHSGAGLAYYSLSSRTDRLFFGFNLGAGVDVPLNNQINLSLGSKLILPMVFRGTGLFFGFDQYGISTNVYADATVPMLQADFSIGLKYNLNNNK